MAAPRHFLDISELTSETLAGLIADARKMKVAGRRSDTPMNGRVLAMVFDKPSTRTRISFDVGMRQLGGETVILSGADSQLGRGEAISDTARVLSRYVDAIMIRTTAHDRLLELADYATVPVINGLTDDTHPCQIMADVLTLEEACGPVGKTTIAWTGAGNNVLNSLMQGSARFGYALNIATPEERAPDQKVLAWARDNGAAVNVTTDPEEAVRGVDCVVTDTWVSMGEDEAQRGQNLLMPYQVNERLMKVAGPQAKFMHCLPAHRGEEVTDAVIDGPQSLVFDEAENRLHAQKAIIAWCLSENV